jgi:hypothetical protein
VFWNLELGQSHLSRLDASLAPGNHPETVAEIRRRGVGSDRCDFAPLRPKTTLSFGSVRRTEAARQGRALQHPQKLGAPSR